MKQPLTPLYVNPDMYENRRKLFPTEGYLYECWSAFYAKEIPPYIHANVVADLGCGTGTAIPLCAPASKIYAVEIVPEMLEYAKHKYEKEYPNAIFLVEDSTKTSVPTNSVDVVLSLGVFCYVDTKKQIGEINRIMKAGAYALIATPNAMNPLHIMIQIRNAIFGTKHNKHFNFYALLIRDFKKAGFTIEKVTSRSTVFYAPKVLQKFAVPIFRFIDFVYTPLQRFFPIGSDIYLVVRKNI